MDFYTVPWIVFLRDTGTLPSMKWLTEYINYDFILWLQMNVGPTLALPFNTQDILWENLSMSL